MPCGVTTPEAQLGKSWSKTLQGCRSPDSAFAKQFPHVFFGAGIDEEYRIASLPLSLLRSRNMAELSFLA